MGHLVDSQERGPGEFVLFALGFLGFIVGATGVVVGSVGFSVVGWLMLLFVVLCFLGRSYDNA